MAQRFEGKVVVVTGASGNVGQAVAQAYAAEGARLALVDRSADKSQPLIASLGIAADRVLAEGADVTDPAAVDALVARVVERFGGIDVAAHTVGGYAAGQPAHEAGVDVWDKMMTLNARSAYVTLSRIAAHMVARGQGGSMVAILARNATRGTAKAAAYSASKAAAQRVIESMSAELKSHGIRVNGIMPGNIDTPQNRAATPDADFSKWVKTADIANAILFLTSDEASAITGDSLEIFGTV